MNIPFYRSDIGKEEERAIADVLNGNVYAAAEDLEDNFAAYVNASYALATSHGTSALHLAMLALDLKRGDKVLCSVNAYPAVPEVVRHFDAEPVFIDINEDTFSIDLNKLEAYLQDNATKKLKAVIVSHIAGQPIDLERLYNIAKIYDVKIVEDASDALGSTFNGDKIGSTGAHITCFSFATHLKKSVCSGGMMVTESEEIFERAKLLRNHAMVSESDGFEYIYDVVDIGSKYTMSDLDAAYISQKLKKQDRCIERQKEIAAIYLNELKGAKHITLPKIGENHSCSLFIIKIDKNRDSFARELDEKGIETGLHYIPLHLLSYYKSKYSLRVNDFPVALRTFQQVLSLPLYASLSDKEIKYICNTVLEVNKSRV
ncbi:MAG: DegT/DnrJ/EryC1/StrS aminotransferase family protein [Campylobacterota bacterium]|nr:DegT/DnrJ/EryC1/StrS aminotransferase family protein [Campylobacterota bacterium]